MLFVCSLARPCSRAHRLHALLLIDLEFWSVRLLTSCQPSIKQGARAFSRCGDIAEQLPREAKRFFPSIDKGFLKVTSKAFEEPVSF